MKKNQMKKTIPCVKYGPLCVFCFRNFYILSCFSGSHHDLEISSNLNVYFSFTTTKLDSGNVKSQVPNKKQKLFFGIFIQNPSHFHKINIINEWHDMTILERSLPICG
jgi:hypothetical protein